MIIEDEGPAFDVSRADPRALLPAENIEPGGFGILLVKNFANKLTYQRVGGLNRAIVEFVR